MEKLNDNIVEMNRDLENLIIQGAATRTRFFKQKFEDRFVPLQFVHLSDVHAVLDLWNRMVEFVNYYSDYISFAIHTGDYCGNNQNQYADCYGEGLPCSRPIYNCVGNHDTVITEQWLPNTKESAHKLLFNHTEGWNATFMDCDHSMTYYLDFPESNIRLIVLDQYFDIEPQCRWLAEILEDARVKQLCVLTAMHEPSGHVLDSFGVTFHTINDYESLVGKMRQHLFEPVIADFIARGGCHICNLVGHEHHDLFGLSEAGILNVAVPCATNWDGWCDGQRVKGTHSYDCFNVTGVDVNLGLLKLIRVGDNADHYLRTKHVLCFDYINRRVIFNG